MQTWSIILAAVLAAAVLSVAGLALVRWRRSREPDGRAAAVGHPRAASTRPAAAATRPRTQGAGAPGAAASVPTADWFAQLTVNAPDEDYFRRMLVMLGEEVGSVEQARLRICMAVAHIALLLWYFDRMAHVFGAGLPAAYREALGAELKKESFEVTVEDYIVDADELGAFLAAGIALSPHESPGSGWRHRTRTPELIDGLVAIRSAGIRAALDADFREPDDGFRIPCARTGNLIVAQYSGRDPASLPSGEILAAMVGKELETLLTAVSNATMTAAAAAVLS